MPEPDEVIRRCRLDVRFARERTPLGVRVQKGTRIVELPVVPGFRSSCLDPPRVLASFGGGPLALERAQRAADARDDGVPGAAFRLRIEQVEAVDRSAAVAGEISAAVEHDPLPLRGDREERWRDARVVEG